MSKLGFIGLGTMGGPMAAHLLRHQLLCYTRSSYPQTLISSRSHSVCHCARGCPRERYYLHHGARHPDVESVLFGENGVAAGLSAGKIVVDMSSISPIDTKQFAERMNLLGCDYLDAPVSGGEIGARAAALTIMVGGHPKVSESVRPLFELMGKNVTLVGSNGDGQTTKIANQIIVAVTIEAVAEALYSPQRLVLSPQK